MSLVGILGKFLDKNTKNMVHEDLENKVMVTKIGQRFPKSKLTFFVGLCINDLLGG